MYFMYFMYFMYLMYNYNHFINLEIMMAINLPPLVTSASQTLQNITQFNTELTSGQGLQHLLSSFVSWYAVKGSDGSIIFGPSKFIGYDNMTATLYLQINKQIDGRATEGALSCWYQAPNTHEEQLLRAELSRGLARFGKAINKRARISTLDGRHITELTDFAPQPSGVVDAMVLLHQTLNESEKRDFMRRVGNELPRRGVAEYQGDGNHSAD
jgi:hypothetical protein